jgi:hypothetical protein
MECNELRNVIEGLEWGGEGPEPTEEAYNDCITTILEVAKTISIDRSSADGRIDSAIKEGPFLEALKEKLLELEPDWTIVISPPRASCDIMINQIRINLKLTDCRSADNSVNKPAIYYSITGQTDYPYSSTWNDFLGHLEAAKAANKIKMERDKTTEYHYLVKNKITGDVILKPIFDINTYISNPSNDLQINWKNEFAAAGALAQQEPEQKPQDYLKKVESLLLCLQKSVRLMIERTQKFAEADIAGLITVAPKEAAKSKEE